MNPRLLRPLATGFNPRTLAGLEAWYAADVASSINIATGVQQWSDLSGNGRHLIQDVTNNQPLYNSVTLNGKPTVTFDGTNDFLRTGNFTVASPFSYIIVFRAESNTNTERFLDGGSPGARSGEFFQDSTADTLGIFNGGSAPNHTFSAGAVATFGIYDVEFDGLSSRIRLAKNSGSGVLSTGELTLSRLTMGGNGAATAIASHCSFAEMLLFSRILAEPEADKVRRYLGNKYNLAFQ